MKVEDPKLSVAEATKLAPGHELKYARPMDSHPPPQTNWKEELFSIATSKKAWIAAIVVFVVVLGRIAVNTLFRDTVTVAVASVRVVYPSKKTMDPNISLPGNIEAIEQASLFAHIGGYLKKLYVDEGDHVKKGQLLAEIEAPDIIEEYNKVKAELEFKKVTKERYDKLLKDGVISEQEYDTVNSTYDESRARYEAAAANMAYTSIRASFDGSIARRYKYPGDLISASTTGNGQSPIFLLINESHLRVAINIPQSDTANVKIGNVVDIKVDTYPDDTFHGTVSRVDDLLDSTTKTERVLIDLENPDRKLHAGMFATVILHFDHKVSSSVVTVPAEAVEAEDGKYFVYENQNGTAHKLAVAIGLKKDDLVEVISGLDEKSPVILRGMTTLKDGDTVKVLNEEKK